MISWTTVSTILEMGIYTLSFHYVFKNIIPIEKDFMGKISVNMMRSAMCGYFTLQGLQMIHDVWEDPCVQDEGKLIVYQNLHDQFMSYFVFDTVILLYQKYLGVEKKVRYDLLLHHVLAITSLMLADIYKMYGISVMITLSEGMSIVSGLKLYFMERGYKGWMKATIYYRLFYIVFVRMLYLWPSVILYYHRVTNECEKYQVDRNIYLLVTLIACIYHAEISWIHSGRKEIKRI